MYGLLLLFNLHVNWVSYKNKQDKNTKNIGYLEKLILSVNDNIGFSKK